jgi:branched-chain amino acid transport system ATP-binding protein
MRARISVGRTLFSRHSIHPSEMDLAKEIMEFAKLTHLKDLLAKALPHGYQRMLGVAMALGADPRLLLLDEPVTGMNPAEMKMMIDLIRILQSRDITILLVEHNVKAVMDLCQRVLVLDFGRRIAEGSPEEIRRNEDVIKAYFGAETP